MAEAKEIQKGASGFWLKLLLAGGIPTILMDAPASLTPNGLAVALIQAVFFTGGAMIIYVLRRRSPSDGDPRSLLVGGVFCLAVVLGAGRIYARVHADPGPSPSIPAKADEKSPPKVTVVVTRQAGEGYGPANMTPEFLANFERYSLARMNALGAEAAKRNPSLIPETIASAGSVYLDIDGKRLAVLRTVGNAGNQGVMIVGFSGSELVRIGCTNGRERIFLTVGACHDKIKQVFGVEIGGN